MKILKVVILGLVLVIGILGSGCNDSGKKMEPENAIIKIGAILPLTGSLSIMGEVEKNAMMLAAEEINKPEQRIEILYEDGKGSPKDAVSAANKLINIDNVELLITSTTGASLAVEPIATANKKNLIAFCMDPDIAKKSPYVMRYYLGIDEEAKEINNYFNNNADIKRVGILYAKVPAFEKVVNNNYIPYINGLNIDITFVESYEIGEKDFRTAVLKMKDEKIDHLILLGYGFEYSNLFSELQINHLIEKLKIIGGWGFLYTTVSPNLLEDVLVSGPEYVFKNQDLAGVFYQNYYNKYNSYPNFDAAFAYNVIISIAQNINKQDLNMPIKEKYFNLKNFSGVVGQYNFTKDGEMIVSTGLGVFKNGKIISY